MRTRRSFTLFWAVLFILSLALQYGSFAAPATTLAGAKTEITICHATASHSNPYIVNSPSIDSNGFDDPVLSGGHNTHVGPVWFSGITVVWGDIIPPYDYQLTDRLFHYSGMNWTTEGQAIYNNGCNIPAPGLAIDKGVSLTNGSGYGPSLITSVGTTVYYRIHVSNTGNAALSGVTLVDSLFDLVAKGCTIPTTLAIGTGFDCDYSDVAKVGTTTNTATADSNETTSVNDSATVTVASAPGLAIDKTASPTSLPFGGGSVIYTYVVTNTGNVSLFGVELVDLITGSETIACSPVGAPVKTLGNQDEVLDVLPETWTYTCTKNITQTTDNTATVTAWTRSETKLTASDSAVVTVGQQPPPQLGSLTITKVVSPAEDFRGGTFTFDVSCATQQTITLAAGEGTKSVTINNLPLGASCTVTEVTPLTAGPGWQWVGQPSYAPGQTVNVPGTVTVTNNWGEVAAATATPRITPPPTTTAGDENTGNPGSNLGLALAALSLFGLVLGALAPTPARARRRTTKG